MAILQQIKEHDNRITMLEHRIESLGQLFQKLGDVIGIEISSLLPPQAAQQANPIDHTSKYGEQLAKLSPF